MSIFFVFINKHFVYIYIHIFFLNFHFSHFMRKTRVGGVTNIKENSQTVQIMHFSHEISRMQSKLCNFFTKFLQSLYNWTQSINGRALLITVSNSNSFVFLVNNFYSIATKISRTSIQRTTWHSSWYYHIPGDIILIIKHTLNTFTKCKHRTCLILELHYSLLI